MEIEEAKGRTMLRHTLLLIVALFIASAGAWSGTRASTACPSCVYLALIRAEMHPIEVPTAAPTLITTPLPAPLLHVRSYRMYSVPGGNVYVVGELENETPYVGHYARVIAKFYDVGGAFVATESTAAVFARIDPGMRNPFILVLTNPPASITRVELIATAGNSGAADYRSAVVLSQLTRDNFGVEVFGEVQNTQATYVSSLFVAVTFYDGAGTVYDVGQGCVDISPLAPNATSTYKIRTYRADLAGLAYRVQAQGYTLASTPVPITFPTATAQPWPTAQPEPTTLPSPAMPTEWPAPATATVPPASVNTPTSVVGAAPFCPY